jgi:molybdopterin-guanine dinucleotide biosynthesis protein B
MNNKPLIIGITGVKNSGKTTLMEKLIQTLSARGLKVASIKHDAHRFIADTPGTDSFRHKAAGAFASVIFDREKFLLVKDGSFDIPDILSFFNEVDIVLVEGAKETPYPKIEVLRKGNSKVPITPTNQLIALMTDTEYQVDGVPSIDINDVEGAVKIILSIKL